MTEYKGIAMSEYPSSPIWGYIALYSSITDDFDNDEPLQRMVKRHYLKIGIYKTLFNLSFYAFPMLAYYILKG